MEYQGTFYSSILREFSEKIFLAVFRGCASCNSRKNVATWINTNTFLQRGDGQEEVDQWLCLLSHLT
jgi:hypothetical protein